MTKSNPLKIYIIYLLDIISFMLDSFENNYMTTAGASIIINNMLKS